MDALLSIFIEIISSFSILFYLLIAQLIFLLFYYSSVTLQYLVAKGLNLKDQNQRNHCEQLQQNSRLRRMSKQRISKNQTATRQSKADPKPINEILFNFTLKFFHYLKFITIGFLVISVSVLLLMNFYYFDQSVKWALNKTYNKTKIRITYDKISGNIFTGHLSIVGLRATRKNNVYSDFDIRIKNTTLKASYFTSIFGNYEISSLNLRQVKGEIRRFNKKPKKQKRDYTIRNLNIRDFQLKLVDLRSNRKRPVLLVKLNSITTKTLTRKYAAFCILFKSNLQGTINKAPIKIQTNLKKVIRETKWEIKNISVSIVEQISGRTLPWLKSGVFDIQSKYTWSGNGVHDIHSKWNINLRNSYAQTPENLSRIKTLLYRAAVKYLNSNYGDHRINFKFRFDKEIFAHQTRFQVSRFWRSLFKGVLTGVLTSRRH